MATVLVDEMEPELIKKRIWNKIRKNQCSNCDPEEKFFDKCSCERGLPVTVVVSLALNLSSKIVDVFVGSVRLGSHSQTLR